MSTAETVPVEEPPATLRRVGHVAVITLNRPHARNAMNEAMSLAVEECVDELLEDPELRVGVITGAGTAFCAGADLKDVAAGHRLIAREQRERGFGGIMQELIEKPLIAAINGFALGGGTELVLACDLAVMSAAATLGLPEVKRGIIAAGGGLIRLPRRVPLAIALEAALTGAPITAEAALHWGLVNRVVPQQQVLDTALDLATSIADNAPLAVRASKEVIHQTVSMGSDWQPDVWQLSNRRARAVMRSADAREGPRAFAEKRQPRWEGR